jgi:hypothetical protein
MEDHIATTPTEPRMIRIRVFSWYSAANYGLLVEIILPPNGVWDQVYPYRHVAVRNITLGERDYERSLCDRSEYLPIGTLTRWTCQGNLYHTNYPSLTPCLV